MWLERPGRAAVSSVPSGNNRVESVASVALLLGVCAAGCSDADVDGQYRADTGHYFMSEICCFSVTVLQELPVE